MSIQTLQELQQIPEPLLDALSELDRRLFGNAAWGREGFLKSAAQEYDHLLIFAEAEFSDLSEVLPGKLSGKRSGKLPELHSADLPGMNSIGNCRLLGYALLRVLDDAELLQIGVEETCRRQGIGRKLMQEVLRLSCGKNLFLEVREGNEAARQLYVRCGFSEIGRRKRYYADPQEDAVLMERKSGCAG